MNDQDSRSGVRRILELLRSVLPFLLLLLAIYWSWRLLRSAG